MAKAINPPTLHELMDDPVYNEYVTATPTWHPLLDAPGAWQVWVRTDITRWRTAVKNTYGDAFSLAMRQIDQHVDDVAIVSKRVFYGPPGTWKKYRKAGQVVERWVPTFTWDAGLEWCARCRRPSQFRLLTSNHHAMRTQPIRSVDDPSRCVFCGIRRAALPRDPYSLDL